MSINHFLKGKTLFISAALAIAGVSTVSALAGTDTANMNLSASADSTCVLTVPDIDFGTITDLAEVQRPFIVTISCDVTPTSSVILTADGGLNPFQASQSAPTERRLKGDIGPSDYLDYDLYQGPTFTGSEPGIGDIVTYNLPGVVTSPGSLDFVAVLHADLSPRAPGNYADTVVWTITF